MSTKPATLPRWSTDLSNATAPSSGQQDTGWTPGQDGVSDYANWLGYWAYKWIEYLRDGALEGDHSIDGSLSVTGNVGCGAHAAVGGDLAVTGSITVDGSVSASDIMQAPDYRWTTARTRKIPTPLYRDAGVLHAWQPEFWTMDGTNYLHVPISVEVGERIHSWSVPVVKGLGSDTINAQLYRVTAAGVLETIGALQTNNATLGAVTLGATVSPGEDVSTSTYGILVYRSGGTGGSMILKAASVSISRP